MNAKTTTRNVIAALGAAVAVVLTAFPAHAVEELSGTGGVMRDAERRAMTPVPEKEGAKTPKISAGNVAEPKLGPMAEKTVGEVATVKVVGSREFAEREGVAAAILRELGANAASATVGDITRAIQTVRGELLKKGYYLVRIMLARQNAYDAQTKTLTVSVDEGRFGKLTIHFDQEDEEGTWFSKRQIEGRFKDIEEGSTFDYNRFRGILFDANSHPDLTIDTKIDVRKPVEGEGEDKRIARYADLNLDVHESIPFHMIWSLDNYGLKEVNEWQTSLTAQYLNLTKHDDVLTISPAMSLGAELFSVAASYMLPHSYWFGGSTTLYGGWSQVEIDEIIPELDLEGMGYFAGLQHTENLYDSDRHLVAFSLGLLWRYLEDQYTVSSKSLNERGAHILPISASLSYTGKKADFLGGRNFATVQGVYNLYNGGDSLSEMWNDAEENYWIFRGQVARLQPLFGWYDDATEQTLHNWQLFTRIEGQYTDQNLVPVEKLMLGGYNCLRGYRTRGYVGDYGIYGTFELRTPLLVDTVASLFGDRTDKVAIDRLQFLGFCDWGIAQYNDLPNGYDDNEFLCSLGVGGRLAVTKYSQVRCDLAFPMVDGNNEDDRDMEVYVSFQLQF